jgi:acyl-CoA oxidase
MDDFINIAFHTELSADDVRNTTSKYWELHSDPIMPMDGAAGSLISIHYNLAVGTFARYTRGRPDVEAILHRLLTFQVL